MKKITLGGIRLIMTLFCASMMAQGTGENSLSTEANLGIQNKSAASGNDLPLILVVGAPGDALWLDDVELKLDNSGLVDADTFLSSAGTPTVAELMPYDAIFVFSDTGHADPAALGDNLVDYLEAGGGIVDATFNPNVPVTGAFSAYDLYTGAGQSNGANLGLGTINDPLHPTLDGVSSFDGGTSSYHNTGGTVASGATVIAEYSTGAPFLIVQEDLGPELARRALLNFYPPSIDARDDFWDAASDGAIIMGNTLVWASKIEELGVNDISTEGFEVYPNPATTQITVRGNFEIASISVFNLLGQKVTTSTSETLNIEALTSALYLVEVTDTDGNTAVKRFIKK